MRVLVPLARDPLDDVDEALYPLALDLVRHLVGHGGRLRSAPRAEHERERAVVAHLLDDLEGLAEVLLRLPREPDDDVRREREVGNGCAHLPDELQVALAPVGSPHALQHPARAGLERQVGVLADRSALGHRPDDGLTEVLRMRAREADPLDAGDCVHGAQKLAELRLHVRHEIAAPRVDVLAEERHLAHAVVRQARHLGDDVAGPAALLAAADGGDDAVRADGVAAHGDLHPGLELPLAMRRQVAGELVPLGKAPALDAHASGAEPVCEMRDRAGAEGDVHIGVELEDPLALRLGVAPADRDDPVGVGSLERGGLREVRREALVGLLADGAGVEDDDVGLVGRERFAEAE